MATIKYDPAKGGRKRQYQRKADKLADDTPAVCATCLGQGFASVGRMKSTCGGFQPVTTICPACR